MRVAEVMMIMRVRGLTLFWQIALVLQQPLLLQSLLLSAFGVLSSELFRIYQLFEAKIGAG